MHKEIISNIRKEIKEICSTDHDSILGDNHEAVKNFSWTTVWLELVQKMPTLMKLLSGVVNNAESHKPVLCLIVSMILKLSHPKISLVQRAISVYLYGNKPQNRLIYAGIGVGTIGGS